MKTFNNFSELAETDNAPMQGGMVTFNMSPKFNTAPNFRGFRFYNYSDELQHGNKLEPKHVHVDTPDGKAKFWLGETVDAPVQLAENKGIPISVINDIQKHIENHQGDYIQDWDMWAKNTRPLE
jgi:hypothetical protein